MISVRVRDDAGAPVNRAEVSVMQSPTSQVDVKTDSNGNADIAVSGNGSHRVWIVPREGYLATDSLSRVVIVGPNASVTVSFTLPRAGRTTYQPPIE